ncbi:MAG: hypothetical protein R3277_07940 [Brumimicrobium sp.]|nr:hypothetical protein [Brumimicrobium sp.]
MILKLNFLAVMILVFSGLRAQGNGNSCPDNINNSPGNSPNIVTANVYDSDGNFIQSITCEATGNSNQIDCDLESYNFPAGSFTAIEITQGGTTMTCVYDDNGDLTTDIIGLPIELSDFDVVSVDGENRILWSTYSEINNSHFIIEHSLDGLNWEEVGQVSGAGNSSEVLFYEFTHRSAQPEVEYYRLSQVDFDGARNYVGVRSVNREGELDAEILDGQIHVTSDNEIAALNCFSLGGREVLSDVYFNSDKYAVITPAGSLSGILIVQVLFENGSVERKKLVLF